MLDQKIIDKITKVPGDTYVIFFVDGCPYCDNARKLLRKSGVSYKGYDISQIDGGMKKLLEVLNKNRNLLNFDPKHQTKPIIFYNGKFVGGFSELSKIIKI